MKPLILLLSLLLAACGESPTGNQGPAMISAAEAGHLQTLQSLIAQGEPVDIEDACQWTPLMKAALNGHTEIVEALLEAGANLNAQDKGGYTPLMLAASNNHSTTVSLLLEHGAHIDHQEQSMGWTALIWAAKQGHTDTVQQLIMHGAQRGIQDFEGKSALDWAQANQHMEVVNLLMAAPQ